ncbi:MAG TPA: xanthine dehydrogenase family protein molybdopterin-binding subunit [Afipia sp.]|uniref:xanthine dehydrogenase family protein molybdopterin-binding subunit n=1 Tax=unclassified Afipia TaxID=2642050 RepID=UPI0004651E04|nr:MULTISPECIES: xanthine dehydrogenase family protein molybdopterin-binding subunit [unclassified Afipia]MAH70327.1 xanthine dehydrogenase family protein molybdopterin-binding subunit [Afipia sp.]OUX60485.1 MAG: quinoline 2-oxidoreductase [Afipia sp. TMED4]HAO41993.1 xanthine dehydrogenase family protein molybdopterin-binding subunit [Afipia sp.]HAP10486.1 xanthine dehydrogenase family protein molybdopterin-binding subunit [Afipia sp.]HAP48988.1 xanthine dehydrogenase family protein molybdopt
MTEAATIRYMGQPLRRREDFKFITGKGRYTDDMKSPGMLHMAILRSPHAHAVIKHVDLSTAQSAPGVHLVLSGADLVGKMGSIEPNWVIPGTKVPDRPVVAVDRVRFVGECVAVVVAETQALAHDAVGLIEVDYETLPAVIDEEAAIREGAPQLHDNVPKNITTLYKIGGGDYKKAANEADHVIKLRVINNRLIPTCMETRSILAEPNVDGTLTVNIQSQVPHMHRRWIADTVRIPEHQLRIVAPDIGGGFGAKMHLYPEELLCPYLARQLGVPVKWWESRSESHQSTNHGRAHTETIEVAFRNDGKILGLRVETLGNVGAYLSNMASGGPTVNTVNFGTGTYKIDNYEAFSRVVVTNTVPVDAYRGYGRPEGGYIAERAIDAVARHLKLDQVEVRKRNFIQRADFPHRPYNGPAVIYDSGNYQGLLAKALEVFKYDERIAERDQLRSQGRYRGIGVAAYTHMCGMAPSRRLSLMGFNRGGWESARVSIDSSGRATIFSGSMSQGHGHNTSLAQIAADVLQIPIESIDIVQGDTRQVQAGHGTFNSRSMAVGGSSVHVTSQRIVAKARKIAASVLEVDEKDVSYRAGEFSVPGTDIAPLSFGKIARMAYVGHKLPDGMEPGLDETTFYDPAGMGSPSGIHMAYIEVDPETGMVDILDYVAVDDVGTIINPLLAAGQIHGGVVQGIAQALYEEVSYDPDTGQLMTGSLLDYAVPRAEHVPNIRSSFQETPSPTNPIGVKGVGESGSIAAPPCMVHAVLDALSPFEILHLDMPMTPPRIWSAVQQARAGVTQ